MDKTIRTLSLFSGGGGLDIGFEKAGFEKIHQWIDEDWKYAESCSCCRRARYNDDGFQDSAPEY